MSLQCPLSKTRTNDSCGKAKAKAKASGRKAKAKAKDSTCKANAKAKDLGSCPWTRPRTWAFVLKDHSRQGQALTSLLLMQANISRPYALYLTNGRLRDYKPSLHVWNQQRLI